jgi:hypothetical protein
MSRDGPHTQPNLSPVGSLSNQLEGFHGVSSWPLDWDKSGVSNDIHGGAACQNFFFCIAFFVLSDELFFSPQNPLYHPIEMQTPVTCRTTAIFRVLL